MFERRKLTPIGTVILTFIISLFAIAEAMAFFPKEQPRDQIGGHYKGSD